MVRTAVLGAGPAGLRHARAMLALDDRCALTGVFDVDGDAAATMAEELGVPTIETLESALAGAEAAVVGGALAGRPMLARQALEAGLDVLVESPLAENVDLAHGLLSSVVRAPRRPVAMVAHEDHFHPVVRTLLELLVGQTLVSVQVERADPLVAGPLPELDVVTDLMLADLLLVFALSDQPVSATQAAGRRLRSSGPIDHAEALLMLDDDVVVSLVASRAGGARMRRVTVTTTQARIVADLDAGTIEALRTTTVEDGRLESVAQRITVGGGDPVRTQAETFLRYVQRRTPPTVGIGLAIAAQESATAILKRIELVAHRPAVRRDQAAA